MMATLVGFGCLLFGLVVGSLTCHHMMVKPLTKPKPKGDKILIQTVIGYFAGYEYFYDLFEYKDGSREVQMRASDKKSNMQYATSTLMYKNFVQHWSRGNDLKR